MTLSATLLPWLDHSAIRQTRKYSLTLKAIFQHCFSSVSILRFSILLKEMITGNDVLLHHTNIRRFNKFPKDSLECLVINEHYRYFSMAIPEFFSLWNGLFTDISLFPVFFYFPDMILRILWVILSLTAQFLILSPRSFSVLMFCFRFQSYTAEFP